MLAVWLLLSALAGCLATAVVLRSRGGDARAAGVDAPGQSTAREPLPLREALDALGVGVVLADRTGRASFRNRVAAGLTGAHHADVLVDEAVERHLHAASAGETRRQVLDLYGPPHRVVAVQARPLGWSGTIAIVEDVTERSRLDTVRTDFVANISHELKTPVGALAVLAEAIDGEDDPVVVQRLASTLVDEAHRVGRTIDDLLELSLIELDSELRREPVDAGLVLADAAARSQALAERSGIRLEVAPTAPGLQVLGDRRQLVSAVANLVDNALKYSEAGTRVKLFVQAAPAAVGGEWLDLCVEDQGIGIPQRDIDRVFERFYRVDRARSRATGGTGLGLAIVRHVATNHGGTVSVTSEEGVGSTFVLRIPARPALAGRHGAAEQA